jgi:hypothetical protein
MQAEDNILETITAEFPQYKRQIIALFNKSISFIEVCEDYAICRESITKLDAMNNLNKEKEINDLKFLLTDLSEEILSKI